MGFDLQEVLSYYVTRYILHIDWGRLFYLEITTIQGRWNWRGMCVWGGGGELVLCALPF
jgi:hypothetical protein